MKRLTDEIKRALSALACAEAGEMLSARQKERFLGLDAPGPNAAPSHPSAVTRAAALRPNRQVALACDGRLSDAMLDYVIGLCRRLEAGLALLGDRATETTARLAARYAGHLAQAGVEWRVVPLEGNGPDQLARYIRDNPQVVLIVSSDGDAPVQAIVGRGRRSRLGQNLAVPLVVLAHDADCAA